MDPGRNQDLRNLMRSADRNRDTTTPVRSTISAATPANDLDLKELVSLIGDIDMTRTVIKERPHMQQDQRSEVIGLAS